MNELSGISLLVSELENLSVSILKGARGIIHSTASSIHA